MVCFIKFIWLYIYVVVFLLESHEQLIHHLGNDDDFICAVILPLAGSTTDELTEEENEQLPIDLQYLPSDKKR